MEDTSKPLLEKGWLNPAESSELELRSRQTSESRPRRMAWAKRFSSITLLILLVLGLFLAAFSRDWAACQGRTAEKASSEVGAAATTELTTASHVSASKREEASTAAVGKPKVLECFQVAQPVLTPAGPTTSKDPTPAGGCTVTLMSHVFGNSYNAPFVGNYVPPSCKFNRVALNFTVVSAGRQFDRLALMYLNDTEVWRTSTAEPTSQPGIRWVYLKDVTEYLSLWQTPQKVIFDLGNLVNTVYTASFNTTLTATFFESDVDAGGAPPSDLIIPISARQSAVGGVSQFTLPKQNATNTISFPRNANRAVFSVSANGQADEEFWWSNVLQSDILAFNATAGTLTGFSPFREVQVYIDGQLAGVQWPFPVVFTGGVVPGLHRPIVGIDDFDLREHEIDITPWLPVLSDGKQHTFTIQVAGLNDDGKASGSAALTQTVAASWYVTGKIFVWLDSDAGAVTTGSAPVVSGTTPSISITQTTLKNSTGANETLQYSVAVARSFSVQGNVKSQSASGAVTWSQSLSYANQGLVTAFGFDQINNFTLRGSDRASGAGGGGSSSSAKGSFTYGADYSFPLYCNTTTNITAQGNMTLWANLIQGLDLQVTGAAVFPTGLEAFVGSSQQGSGSSFTGAGGGSLLSTRVNGTASFFQTGDGKNSSGFGTTNQVFRFGGLSAAGMLGQTPDIPLYTRNVTAVNGTVVYNQESIAGRGQAPASTAAPGAGGAGAGSGSGVMASPQSFFAQAPLDGGTGPRVFTGRGGSDPTVAVDTDGTPAGDGDAVHGQAVMGA